MNRTAEYLFDYLHDLIYSPEKAELDKAKLPEDFQNFGEGLAYLGDCISEVREALDALSKGSLDYKPPSRDNEFSAPIKSLHASLKHLTWQAQQIADGDYKQRVSFMGTFADAFNVMTEQLAERQEKLESKIEELQDKTSALEASNVLIDSLIQEMHQQIVVIDQNTNKILHMNKAALAEIEEDPAYFHNIQMAMLDDSAIIVDDNSIEVAIDGDEIGAERYLRIDTHSIQWSDSKAKVFTISDITIARQEFEALETQAYTDHATGLFNRNFGMTKLKDWVDEGRRFNLIFIDLDNLKYINDVFGHSEGDEYIRNVAKKIKGFSPASVACRVGGDEFMLLIPDMSLEGTHEKMEKLSTEFINHEYLKDKEFTYGLSYGIAMVDETNKLSAADVLSIADERMYENKRAKKKLRQTYRERER